MEPQEHTSPLRHSLHWLPVQQRIKHKVCSICYASLTGTGPKCMSEFVNVYTFHPDACAHRQTAAIPYVKTKICGQRSFAYQGPATWNDLPCDLSTKIHCPLSKVL